MAHVHAHVLLMPWVSTVDTRLTNAYRNDPAPYRYCGRLRTVSMLTSTTEATYYPGKERPMSHAVVWGSV